MVNRILTFTDCTDVASSELHATLNRLIDSMEMRGSIVVDPFIYCMEFSVINCAFMVRLMAESCKPENTIFLVIANALPTVRSNRARLVGQTKNGFRFVGENTGTLSWMLDDFGLKEVYEYSSDGLDGPSFVSFGGKYFHAPEAVKVASKTSFDNYRTKFDPTRLTKLNIIEGTIVHIDNFGVAKIKTNLPKNLIEGDKLRLTVNGINWNIVTFSHAMKNLSDGTWAIYRGSSMGLVEVGCVRRITKGSSGLRIGDIIGIERN